MNTDCDRISLLLGSFADGELEPRDMQDVARHLATCTACEEVLGDFNAISLGLRDILEVPSLGGFAAGVSARIAMQPAPLRERVSSFFESLNQRWMAAFAMVSMAGAVAVLTALVLTPYLRHNVGSGQIPSIAKVDTDTTSTTLASAPEQQYPQVFMPSDKTSALTSTAGMNPGDSRTIIERLESQIPTTAVWSEPTNNTTVIWLPSEP